MEEIIQTLIKTFTIYLVLHVLARVLGRKLISQITFFDFVVGVVIGSLGAQAMTASGSNLKTTTASLVLLTILTLVIEYGVMRSFRIRKLVDSEPLMIIKKGQIIEKNMKKERYDITVLMMHLREKNIFNIADVEYAILEHDGKLSVMPKSDKRPMVPSDLSLTPQNHGLAAEIIIDGKVMEDNLKAYNKDRKWLDGELRKQNLTSEQIFLATCDLQNNLYISLKDKYRIEGQHVIE